MIDLLVESCFHFLLSHNARARGEAENKTLARHYESRDFVLLRKQRGPVQFDKYRPVVCTRNNYLFRCENRFYFSFIRH